MDHALPMPASLDRRTLTRLLFAGAAGTALAGAGIPVNRADLDGLLPLDSFRRITATLATSYDTDGPGKVLKAAVRTERAFAGMLAGGAFPPRQVGDAKAAYARLLTLGAQARTDVGLHDDAATTATLAASLAEEVCDAQAGGHAWTVASAAMLGAGQADKALDAALRAQRFAGSTPAMAMALDAEASAAAALGRVHTVLDAVTAMEAAQRDVPEVARGTFGAYSDAHVAAFGGAALAAVGLYGTAAPRLDAAADMLTAADGLMVHVLLTQARVAVAEGDADDAAELAAGAVASAEARPSAWVAGAVVGLDRTHRDAGGGGEFEELVATVGGWTFPASV